MPSSSLKQQVARGNIVHAAIDVFAKLGVEATRVEDLLEASGIARRTFYKYFRSKEDVLAALYELVTRQLLDNLRALGAARATQGEPLASIRTALDGYLELHVHDPRILRILQEHAVRADSPLAPIRRRFRAELVRLLDDAFRAATGRDLDPFVFLALVSALEGISLEILATKPSPADVARARATMHGLLDALLRAPDSLPSQKASTR